MGRNTVVRQLRLAARLNKARVLRNDRLECFRHALGDALDAVGTALSNEPLEWEALRVFRLLVVFKTPPLDRFYDVDEVSIRACVLVARPADLLQGMGPLPDVRVAVRDAERLEPSTRPGSSPRRAEFGRRCVLVRRDATQERMQPPIAGLRRCRRRSLLRRNEDPNLSLRGSRRQNEIEFNVRQLDSERAALLLPLPLVVLVEEGLEHVHRLRGRVLGLGELRHDDDVDVRASVVLRAGPPSLGDSCPVESPRRTPSSAPRRRSVVRAASCGRSCKSSR